MSVCVRIYGGGGGRLSSSNTPIYTYVLLFAVVGVSSFFLQRTWRSYALRTSSAEQQSLHLYPWFFPPLGLIVHGGGSTSHNCAAQTLDKLLFYLMSEFQNSIMISTINMVKNICYTDLR